MEPLQELELILLAKDVPHTKFAELCNALGFSFARGQSILATHHNDFIVTMQNILMEWKIKQTDATQSRSILASKLRKIGLGALGDKLSHGAYQPKPNQCDPRNLKTTPLECDSDIYSKKISESLTVGQCREKLKNRYLHSFCKVQKAPWDPNDLADFNDLHTVVTMVKKDARGKDTKMKEILQGSVDEILSMKVNGELPVRILVSAPAGRGKTTAVAKIAYDWANRVQGSSLENLPLLFVVKLRNTSKQTSIAEAIRFQLLSDVTDLTQDGLHRFIKENQGICHILLDGLDEYAGIAGNEGMGSNIVDVMLWEEYPECRVLITTRPHLEDFFNQGELPRVYTKMWIEGFSRKSSREYIDKFFALTFNESSGLSLKVYLDSQPLINELVTTPLFCLMVCHLWSKELLGKDTATQTKLLDDVNLFMMHHANARSQSGLRFTTDQVETIICSLGEIALAGVMDDAKKLIFTPSDFSRHPGVLDRACELGIISRTVVSLSHLPQSHDTTSTIIEFYHKLAQEHSAGKHLAAEYDKWRKGWRPWMFSTLNRVLNEINENISDYEHLLRFAAGSDNGLCERVMKAILGNRYLNESERYRILLDCSSETTGTEKGVSSLVQRCVTAEQIFLKSPTVYTVVGMQNLPEELKGQIQEVKFEDSTVCTDVTSGLWSCLQSFSVLHTLIISDSSLSFPRSPPELLSVTELRARRVTSQSYKGLLSSLPSLKEIDVTIDDDVEGNTSQITASESVSKSEDQHLPVHIKLQALPSLSRDQKSESREMVAELCLLIREPTDNLLRLQVTGLKGQDGEAVVNVFVKSAHVKSLNVKSAYGSQIHDRQAVEESRLEMKSCQLSVVMTESLWSCFSFMTSLQKLSISDSSLSFPSSPPELPSVISLRAERVTSQSYAGLLSSIPNVKEIDITVGNAQGEDLSRIQTVLRRHLMEQELALIRLNTLSSKESGSGETMSGHGLLTNTIFGRATLLGVVCGPGETMIDLVQRSTRVMPSSLYCKQVSESLNSIRNKRNMYFVTMRDCKLTAMVTSSMWFYLRSFPSLGKLTISDSSLSFLPSPPELTSVTKLEAKGVTSQSYEGLLSSLPGLTWIEITMNDAERDISQITAGLRRTGRQQLTSITIKSPKQLPPEKKNLSRETMQGLSLLIIEQTKNLQSLSVSGVKCTYEDYVDFIEHVQCSKILRILHFQFLRWGSLDYNRNTYKKPTVTLGQCQLSTEMTIRLWSCLRSFPSLRSLTISDSSLSFPPSPPELTSVTRLIARRVTPQSYEGLLSSLPGLKEIDITMNDAERDISQITAGLRRTGGQQLTRIDLRAQYSLPQEKKTVSRETMRGLSLLIIEHIKNLQSLSVSGVKCIDEDYVDLIEHVQCLKILHTLHFQFLGWGSLDYKRNTDKFHTVTLGDCQLSTEMAVRLWTCLKSFTSLIGLTISDSSLSFPPSPPELTSVTRLIAKIVTSQSYEGLLSSLPGLEYISIIIDDAERDISPIMACLRRTRGQQLKRIDLHAQDSLPQEKKTASRETMRGLGLLIREQTKNLQWLGLTEVKCTDEEDLVDLIECCRHVKAMEYVELILCGTKWGGRLESHLKRLPSSGDALTVEVEHDGCIIRNEYRISHSD